jgi:hypothetical protein
MYKRLINRIWSLYLPILLIIILYAVDKKNDSVFEISFSDFLALGSIIVAVIQTVFFFKRDQRKRQFVANSVLEEPFYLKEKNQMRRIQFCNLKISISEETIDIYDKLTFKFSAKLKNKTILVKSVFKTTIYSFDEIESILYEFDRIFFVTLKPDHEKNLWVNKFSIVLKNKKIIYLFSVKSEKDHMKDFDEDSKYYSDEYHFKLGSQVLEILSSELNLKYSILDYTQKASS